MHAQVENVLLGTIVERVQLIHKPGIPYVLLIGDAPTAGLNTSVDELFEAEMLVNTLTT
jgi:hypothetical protein